MSDMKTCFKRMDYDLFNLLHHLDIGDIGLQKPPFTASEIARGKQAPQSTPASFAR